MEPIKVFSDKNINIAGFGIATLALILTFLYSHASLLVSVKAEDKNEVKDELMERSEANRLYITATDLLLYTRSFANNDIDSTSRYKNYNYINSRLAEEMSNTYLLKNENLFKKWARGAEVIKVALTTDMAYTSLQRTEYQKHLNQEVALRYIFDLSGEACEYALRRINKKKT